MQVPRLAKASALCLYALVSSAPACAPTEHDERVATAEGDGPSQDELEKAGMTCREAVGSAAFRNRLALKLSPADPKGRGVRRLRVLTNTAKKFWPKDNDYAWCQVYGFLRYAEDNASTVRTAFVKVRENPEKFVPLRVDGTKVRRLQFGEVAAGTIVVGAFLYNQYAVHQALSEIGDSTSEKLVCKANGVDLKEEKATFARYMSTEGHGCSLRMTSPDTVASHQRRCLQVPNAQNVWLASTDTLYDRSIQLLSVVGQTAKRDGARSVSEWLVYALGDMRPKVVAGEALNVATLLYVTQVTARLIVNTCSSNDEATGALQALTSLAAYLEGMASVYASGGA